MSGTRDPSRTGFVSRMLLKAFGPAQITPADDDDRSEQQTHHDRTTQHDDTHRRGEAGEPPHR